MTYPAGVAKITEIRVNNKKDYANHTIELVIEHGNGEYFTVNYSKII